MHTPSSGPHAPLGGVFAVIDAVAVHAILREAAERLAAIGVPSIVHSSPLSLEGVEAAGRPAPPEPVFGLLVAPTVATLGGLYESVTHAVAGVNHGMTPHVAAYAATADSDVWFKSTCYGVALTADEQAVIDRATVEIETSAAAISPSSGGA